MLLAILLLEKIATKYQQLCKILNPTECTPQGTTGLEKPLFHCWQPLQNAFAAAKQEENSSLAAPCGLHTMLKFFIVKVSLIKTEEA
jgi:hypothetical protein